MRYTHLDDWRKKPELSLLRDLPDPPKILYYAGRWNASLFANCVAVIGSRRMTEYGRRVIEKIIPALVFEKKTIVSGFMYGVDQYAHKICIENGGKTIAVLGWGMQQKLENGDRKLAEKIIESGGVLLSEWEDQKPTLWTFPVRNRIVAALSHEILVVEAAAKSGSLITANIGLKLKRALWAVPGPITSSTSVGTNALIAEGKARMWVQHDAMVTQQFDDPILSMLSSESLSASEIARKLNKSIAEIGAQLSMFELSGQVIAKGGKYYPRQN